MLLRELQMQMAGCNRICSGRPRTHGHAVESNGTHITDGPDSGNIASDAPPRLLWQCSCPGEEVDISTKAEHSNTA